MGKIHIVFGPQGAGKSTYAKQLSKKVNGIHISIDDWMWNLYGEDLPQSMNLTWIMERVERCEKQIMKLAIDITQCNRDVILDLGFTKLVKRKLFLQLAEDHNKKTQIHYINAPHAIRRERVLNRNKEKGSTFSFEVTPGMFDFMEKEFHSPTEQELKGAVIIDTSIK